MKNSTTVIQKCIFSIGIRAAALVMLLIITSATVFSQTNAGTKFWVAETPNLGDQNNFAISIANPSSVVATITITNPIRPTVTASIAPGTLQTFQFPTVSSQIQFTGTYTQNVFRVLSTNNVDVVVYSFTPLVNSFTNDAALILPDNSLGKKYRPGSYADANGNTHGSFFGVVATQSGTNVKTYNTSGALVDNVTINVGQYFQRNNGIAPSQDITGWYIETDKPAAVFSGSLCTSLGNSNGACDHIDEEVLPLETMASTYIASPTNSRPIGCTTCAPDVFRYVATEDGTTITTSPNVGGGTINKGQYLQISTNVPHVVSSNNKPFYGYQYLISQDAGFPVAGIGDPSLLGMPPVDQFQYNYLFLTPNTFAYDFINLVAPVGTSFTLDGSPISPSFQVVGSIGSVTYAAAKLPVSDGVHKVAANKQFGLIVSGFDQYASYAYLGGIGLQPINAGCITGGPYQLTSCTISPIQLNGTATCSDGSTPTSIQWNSSDGVTFSNPNIANPTATVPGYGTFNICLTVTCGSNSVECCSQITVNPPAGGCNTPPVAVCKPVTVSANSNCNGNAIASDFNNGSTDADGDVIALTISPVGPYALGTTNVILTVTDTKGASSTCNTTVTVTNDPPVIGLITVQSSPVAINTPFNLTIPFTDNNNNVVKAVIDWEGTSETILPVVPNQTLASPLVVPHTYIAPGVYTVKVTLTDACGATATAIYNYVVAYDPNGSFVTGGGWINSPIGSYRPNPNLTGRANFGFVSKYQKGATVPTGNTEFQYQTGGMNFNSTSYDWLVVSGSRAQYKGLGTINGGGNYGFLLTGVDGDLGTTKTPDLFRIKIWDINNGGQIVYDNQFGAGDGDALTTTLAGGSIVIHTPTGKNSTATSPASIVNATNELQDITNAGKLTATALPNPARGKFTIRFGNTSLNQKVNVRVTDMIGRLIETRANLAPSEAIQLGEHYTPGTYLIEVIQGTQRKTLKVIKGD